MFPVLKYSAGKGTEGGIAEAVDGSVKKKIQKKEDAQPVSSSRGPHWVVSEGRVI